MEIEKASEILTDIVKSGIPPLEADVLAAVSMGAAALTGVKKLHDSSASDYFRDIHDDVVLAGFCRTAGRGAAPGAAGSEGKS